LKIPVSKKIIEIKRKYIEETNSFTTLEEFLFTSIDGINLDDNNTLKFYNLGTECTIHCSLVLKEEIHNISSSYIKFSTSDGRILPIEIPTLQTTTLSGMTLRFTI
jgi:hypothetical protein